MRQIKRARQALDLARLARGFRAQAVIDGDGDQARTARKRRRQRAASHISAIESGPPDTARTIAGAAFQSANRRFASLAEIGEWSSLSAMISLQDRSHSRVKPEEHAYGGSCEVLLFGSTRFPDANRIHPAIQVRGRLSRENALALVPLLLAVDGLFDAAEARGYFRNTSPSAAQAASFSFSAASDCPSRRSASGAFADLSNLVVTPRKASAASRYFWRWK